MKTTQELREIRQDIENAMKAIAVKHNIKDFKLGTMRHDNDGFRTTLEVQYEGGENQDMKALKMNAPYIGFKDGIAGATIQYGGKECKVMGMRRTKLVLEIGGKSYTAKIEDVQRSLQLQKSQYVA